MNKLVRRHYPIENLPDDLRVGLPERGWVSVDIAVEAERPRRSLKALIGSARNIHGGPDEVVTWIRNQRDEP